MDHDGGEKRLMWTKRQSLWSSHMVLVNFAPPVSLIRGRIGTGTDSKGENESSLLDAFLLVQGEASEWQAGKQAGKQAGRQAGKAGRQVGRRTFVRQRFFSALCTRAQSRTSCRAV